MNEHDFTWEILLSIAGIIVSVYSLYSTEAVMKKVMPEIRALMKKLYRNIEG
jgi:hypothetical protein